MYSIGIQRIEKKLKVALVSRTQKTIVVEQTYTLPEENLTEGVKRIYNLALEKKAKLVSGLNSWEMLLRKTRFPLTSPRAILSVLPFQIETLVPYPVEDLICIPFFHPRTDRKKAETEVTLFATSRKEMERHTQTLSSLQILPDVVSSAAIALCRFLSYATASSSTSSFILDMNGDKSSCVCVLEGNIVFSHSLNIGCNHFLYALGKDLPEKSPEELEAFCKEIDWLEINASAFPHLHAQVAAFQKELEKTAAFLKKKELVLPHFVLTGEGLFGLAELLEAILEIPPLPLEKDNQNYAVPIGLAIDSLLEDERSIQFQVGQHAPVHSTKKRKKQVVRYALCSLLLCGTIWSATSFLGNKREEALIGKLKSAAPHLSLTSSLSDTVIKWERSLNKQKVSFPYFLSVPSVSDTLAWLSTHKVLASSSEHRIDIKRVHYKLVHYPTLDSAIDSSKSAYQAKIEIEFTASVPRAAREFHEALLGKDPFIDNKQEVTWKVRQNTYLTSFFLKETSQRK